ncbi:leucine-rich repeat domain-containing protein [Pengzhenrongella phosphoraccumulans]|uniref:leucine-rich repeat domain-containing protein n=1 Tax=Pengzhenrongella phosphoraccumulans TaxID=3114394 RepID=UPI00388EFED8
MRPAGRVAALAALARVVTGVVAGLTALLALVLAAPMLLQGVPIPLGVLLVALGATPGALLLSAAPERRRPVGLVLVVAGLMLALGGLAAGSRWGFLPLPVAMLTWRLLATAAQSLAPLGLVATGAALALAGAGLLARRRGVVIVAVLLAFGTTGYFAGSTLALSNVLGLAAAGWRDAQALAVSIVLAVVAVLLAVALVRLVAPRRSPGWPSLVRVARVRERGGHRRVRVVAGAGLALGAAAGVAFAAWSTWAPGTVLSDVITDPALAACVAEAMDEPGPEATVSSISFERVLSLSCNGDLAPGMARIRSLNGVAKLTHLATLDLSSNEVSDLTPLTGMPKLGSLKLTHNLVTDLTPLAGLPVLTDLGLTDNAVSDVGPLAQVPTLRYLGLARNQIGDLGPLAGLTGLVELDVSENQVADVEALAALTQLDRLTLSGNTIVDPSVLGALPYLTMLDIARNRIADAGTFVGFGSLTELWVGGNVFTDVSPLAQLPALMGVDVEDTDSATRTGVDVLEAHGIYVGGRA